MSRFAAMFWNTKDSGQDRVFVDVVHTSARSLAEVVREQNLPKSEVVAIFWLESKGYEQAARLLAVLLKNRYDDEGNVPNLLSRWITKIFQRSEKIPRRWRPKGWKSAEQKLKRPSKSG